MSAGSLAFMIPGDLEALTGGYAYDRRIIGGLRHLGWTVDVESLDASFPDPTPFAREDARRRFASLADGSVVMVDGLAFGALAVEAEDERRRLRLVALVHHPLADETGIAGRMARSLEASERRALATTRAVVATSRPTADRLGALRRQSRSNRGRRAGHGPGLVVARLRRRLRAFAVRCVVDSAERS